MHRSGDRHVGNELMRWSISPPCRDAILRTLGDISHVYSWVLYGPTASHKHHRLDVAWSKTQSHNCVTTASMLAKVERLCEGQAPAAHATGGVLGYDQPPAEVLLHTLRPLVWSLAISQHNYWQEMDVEDLVQMCSLRLVALHKAGYYVHKSLLRRAFANDVLMALRRERGRPTLCSLESIMYDGHTPLADTVVDESQVDPAEIIAGTTSQQVDDERLRVISRLLTPRQMDQVLFEYGTKNTTATGRAIVQRVKKRLAKMGLTTGVLIDRM